MISMPKIQSIRQRRRNGESVASIARGEKVSEPTVRKYLKADDLSARPPVRRRRGSVLDEWIPVCVCSIESGPCERVDVFHVSGRFWSTSACGEKRTPARPAWTSFPS